MFSARSIFVALTLTATLASAQTPPTNTGGRPFGGRSGSDHGGPFTPGSEGAPAGPFTPGTTPGGNGNGPFTPGTGGNPAGPYTPGTIEGPTSGGPFTRNDGKGGGGFWGRVKDIGASVWGGIVSVGNFIWTLGGLAPWAHMPAVGTIPNNGVGVNVGRNDNTTPNVGGIDPLDGGRPGRATAPGVAGNAATAGTRERPSGTFFNP